MANDFAEKLRVTARALGCVTQKELCMLFREANSATSFTLDNSYKWMSGLSLPN
ncbi:MAG TPA: hypothetical protein VLA52_10000 [Thermohalobaculum sp.]|nr:hypothetical protein [Thermohalobaculum sp.]